MEMELWKIKNYLRSKEEEKNKIKNKRGIKQNHNICLNKLYNKRPLICK